MFKVGEVVVCVDDRLNPDFGPSRLRRGKFYKVARIGAICNNSVFGRGGTLFLEEVPSESLSGFSAKRFRKLPKADQSFTDMIRACKPVKEPA